MGLPAGTMRSNMSQAPAEDMEAPMLEFTTALSDGYASPRRLSNASSRVHTDEEDGDENGGDEEAPNARLRRSFSTEADLEAGDTEGLGSQRRSRDRCWGCTASRVGETIITNLYRLVLLGLIVTLLILFSLKGWRIFGPILSWFEKQNSWWPGWVCFLLLFTANVALFLPGMVLVLGAGFIFGFWKGLLAVWVGGSVGQAAAFLLARYLVRYWVVTYVARKWSKWELVDDMIEEEGWILVVLLRLAPIVPWNLLNIGMATTRIHFISFTVASAIGILFESSILAYFGSLAQDIHHIVGGKASPHGPVVYVLTGVSLAVCGITAIIATVYTKRALKKAAAHREASRVGICDEDAAGSDGGHDPEYGAHQEGVYDRLCSPQPGAASTSPWNGTTHSKRTTAVEVPIEHVEEVVHSHEASQALNPDADAGSRDGFRIEGMVSGVDDNISAVNSKRRIFQDGIELQASLHSPVRKEDIIPSGGVHVVDDAIKKDVRLHLGLADIRAAQQQLVL